MKRKKQKSILACVITLCMVFGMQSTAFAAEPSKTSSESVEDFVVNQSVISFAGYDWWVIGDESTGIYSQPDSITLLVKNKTIYSNEFGTTQFGAVNSNYSESVLREKMEEIANSFSAKEQTLINPRTLQGGGDSKNPSADGIAGDTVSNQKLWALSETERAAIDNLDVRKYNFAFWLRSPSGANWAEMGNGSGGITGFVPFNDVTRSDVSIRPALSLDISSVLLTTTLSDGTIKLTVKDDSMNLDITDTSDKIIEKGQNISIPYTDAATGENQYISCILTDTDGNIVKDYGQLQKADSETGVLSVVTEDLAIGNYKLNVFAKYSQGEKYTDFCSNPISINLEVTKATPAYTIPTGLTATVGQTLADVTLPDGFTWQDDTATSVGTAGTHTFKVTYTPEDTDNYSVVKDIEVTLTVKEKEPQNPTTDDDKKPSGTNTDKKPADKNKQTASSIPKTGDTANIALVITLIVLSGGLCVIITGIKRKRTFKK